MQGEIVRLINWNTVAVRLFSKDAHNDVVLQLQPRALHCKPAALAKATVFAPLPCVVQNLGIHNGRLFVGGQIQFPSGMAPAAAPSHPSPACFQRPRVRYFD